MKLDRGVNCEHEVAIVKSECMSGSDVKEGFKRPDMIHALDQRVAYCSHGNGLTSRVIILLSMGKYFRPAVPALEFQSSRFG